ncbi:Hypothetical protein D9617_19g101930 [Elsinoe fawcettii]|nr:Hypothetical protein D9617_19g101930 [Elsinoe fawcettii]
MPNKEMSTTQGERLNRISGLGVLTSLLDGILALTSILFIVLAIVAYILDGKPASNNRMGTIAQQASDLGPTVFPLLFAAIVAPALRNVARFKVERSPQRLGVLESLLGSRTVVSTLETQILLGRLTWLGAGLLLVWSLSPLGGQASLRVLTKGRQFESSVRDLRYLDTSSSLYFRRNIFDGFLTMGQGYTYLQSTFTASLLTSSVIKSSPQDPWGNVKIPRLESVRLAAGMNDDGWSEIPDYLSPNDYTSLTGIPMSRFPPDPQASSTFYMNYSYINFQPSHWTIGDQNGTWWLDMIDRPWDEKNMTRLEKFPDFGYWQDFDRLDLTQKSFFFAWSSIRQPPLRLYDTDLVENNIPGPKMSSRREVMDNRSYNLTLVSRFESTGPGHVRLMLQNFTMHQVDAEVRIDCTGSNCAAKSIRGRPSAGQNRTQDLALNPTYMNGIVAAMPWVFGGPQQETKLSKLEREVMSQISGNTSYLLNLFPDRGYAYNSSLELFLRGMDVPGPSAVATQDVPLITSISGYDLARRLGTVFNTVAQLSADPDMSLIGDIPGPDSESWTSKFLDRMNVWQTSDDVLKAQVETTKISSALHELLRQYVISPPPFSTKSTTEQVETYTAVYRCHKTWASILLLSSLFLFTTGLANFLLRFWIRAPDIMAYVSSMTCDNHYFSSTASSVLDGLDRSRLLYDEKVLIGDVHGHEEIGHIAFAAHAHDQPQQKLSRDRLYV